MKSNVRRELEKRLVAEEFTPPADLVERLKSDIPPSFGIVRGVGAEEAAAAEPAAGRDWARPGRAWLLAASLATLVCGALVAYRVSERLAPPGVAAGGRLAGLSGAAKSERSAAKAPAPPALQRLVTEADLEQRPADAGQAQGEKKDSDRSEGAGRENPASRPAPAAPAEITMVSKRPLPSPQAAPAGALSAPVEPEAALPAIAEPMAPMRVAEAPPALQVPRPGPPPRKVAKESKLRALGYAGGASSEELKKVPSSRDVGSILNQAPGEVSPGGAPQGPPPSTGGSAEPNDQPYGDMFFRPYGVNPAIDTEEDRLSTFGLDVDTGSYTLLRRYLTEGHLPPPEAVRVEEMVNFFDYRDKPPAEGDFALYAEGAPTPFAAGERYRLLRFAVKAREVSAAARKPAVLTFVVDVSGSMEWGGRLELVKQALSLLLGELRPDDRVGLVIYGDRGQVLLDPTGDLGAVSRAIGRLAPGGSTNAEEGIVLGYRVASDHFRPDGINRVILLTDGVANVGATGPDSILARARREAQKGIDLTAIGVGIGNYNDALLERLADQGDGGYAYVDSVEEARRVFVEKLTGTLQTIAGDAKAQVEFDPRVVARWRLIGYENRDIADERFRDDTVDAGEIGAGHAVTALYEVKLQPEAEAGATAAILRLRYRSRATGQVVEQERRLRLSEMASSWETASPALRLASVTAELGEVLRASYWAKGVDLDALFRRAQTVVPLFPGDADVAELASLIGKAARLADARPKP